MGDNMSSERFVCPWAGCTRRYTTQGNLKTHEKTHTGEFMFRCESCSKPFLSSYALKVHVRIHTQERPFICEYLQCLSAFNTLYRLNAHRRIHTGIISLTDCNLQLQCSIILGNTFNCTDKNCGKIFTTKSDLKKHRRVHTHERPYKCEHANCDKSFVNSHHLKSHQKTHLKPKIRKENSARKDVQTLNEEEPRVHEIYPNEMQTTSLSSESSETSLLELHTAVEEFTNNMVTDMDGLDLASTWLDDVEIAIANVLAEPPWSETLSIEQPTTFHTETGENENIC